GFGGTNAHLVLDEWDPAPAASAPVPKAAPPEPVVIVALGVRAGTISSAAEFATVLRSGSSPGTLAGPAAVGLTGLRFPPRDLTQTLGQQTLMMEAAREAAHGVQLPRDRTAVVVGAGCDAETARYPARWRAAGWVPDAAAADLAKARDGIVAAMTAAGTLGML